KRAGYKASQPFARSKEADAFAPQPCQEPGYVYAFAAYPCVTCAAVRAFGKYVHRRIRRKREYHYKSLLFPEARHLRLPAKIKTNRKEERHGKNKGRHNRHGRHKQYAYGRI